MNGAGMGILRVPGEQASRDKRGPHVSGSNFLNLSRCHSELTKIALRMTQQWNNKSISEAFCDNFATRSIYPRTLEYQLLPLRHQGNRLRLTDGDWASET